MHLRFNDESFYHKITFRFMKMFVYNLYSAITAVLHLYPSRKPEKNNNTLIPGSVFSYQISNQT